MPYYSLIAPNKVSRYEFYSFGGGYLEGRDLDIPMIILSNIMDMAYGIYVVYLKKNTGFVLRFHIV